MLRWLPRSLFCRITHYESAGNNCVVAAFVVESVAELAICDSKSGGRLITSWVGTEAAAASWVGRDLSLHGQRGSIKLIVRCRSSNGMRQLFAHWEAASLTVACTNG